MKGVCALEKRVKRKIWLDLLRSVAIFVVALGHFTAKTNPVQMIIAPIMLPLFYIISGMLYKSSGGGPDSGVNSFCHIGCLTLFFRCIHCI